MYIWGQILLILGVILFGVGTAGILAGFLPTGALVAMNALAIIFVGTGASINRKAKK